MDVTNNIGNGVAFIPHQPEKNKASERVTPESKALTIEHSSSSTGQQIVKMPSPEAVARSDEFERDAEHFRFNAQFAEKQVAAYASLENESKKEALSQMMGVDIYA
jgi:hypothetical protein